VTGVSTLQPVNINTTGARKCGRPRKNIDAEILHEAFQKGRHISTTLLASVLGVDWKTLQARKTELEISSSFDDISDEDLDKLVQIYHQENPAGGRSYVMGHLCATHSLRIQRQRVIDSLNRVDKLGQATGISADRIILPYKTKSSRIVFAYRL
jgi:hypothetical protein